MNKQISIRNSWQYFLTLVLFVVIAFFTRIQLSHVPDAPNDLPESTFSGVRAHQVLTELLPNDTPHFVDSASIRQVEKRLVDTLVNLGYQPEIQDTPICADWRRGVARCTHVRNIIVHIVGTDSGNGILLSAHYDSVPAGPGGSDAGAAVATLLETARLLASEPQPKNSIVLLFNEGEEFGLFGAEAFMQKHPLAKQLKLALNIEARGSAGKSVMFETGEDSGWLVGEYAKATSAPLSSSLFYEVYKYLPNDTDLTVFKDSGLQGLNFAHAELEAHYHTPLDNLANLSPGTIQLHGDNVWHVVKQIKDEDLTSKPTGNVVFTDLLGLSVIQWPESWTLWFVIGLLALLIIINVRLYQSKLLGNGNVLSCLGMMMLSVFVAAITAFLIQKGVQWLDSEFAPWRANPLPMRLSIWIGVFSSCLLFGFWFIRSQTPISALLSGLYLWVLLALVTALVMPGISFLFILPAFITLLILLTLFFFRSEKTDAILLWGSCLFALTSAITFMPIAHILEVMVSYYMSTGIGIMLGFAAISLLPLLIGEKELVAKTPKITFAGLSVALVLAGWTIFQPPYSEKMPQPLNLIYLQSDQHPSALSIGRANQSLPTELKNKIVDGKNAPAFPWVNREYRLVDLDAIETSQVTLITGDALIEGTTRKTSLTVNAEQTRLLDLKLLIPVDSKLSNILYGEETIQYKNEANIRNGYYEFHCRGESCASMNIILEFDSVEATEVIVSAAYSGLPASLKEWSQARDGMATARQSGDLSMQLHRVQL